MDNTLTTYHVITAILVILSIAAGVYFGKVQCSAKAEKMGFECDWGLVQGCMIQVNGKWMPMESYRIIE